LVVIEVGGERERLIENNQPMTIHPAQPPCEFLVRTNKVNVSVIAYNGSNSWLKIREDRVKLASDGIYIIHQAAITNCRDTINRRP
jgi:hypothetical protein